MTRLWAVLLAIVSVNAMLLSACPITPPTHAIDDTHGGGGGGPGGGNM
jgi:hypothetical protein